MTFTQRTKLMLLAGFAFSLMTVTPLEGQRGRRGGRRGPPPPERAGLQQRVRVRMDEMIRERLDLTEEEWEEIGDEARDFEQERGALMRQEQALRLRVDVLILEGSEDDEEAGEILDRLITLRRQELGLFQREQERLLEILSPSQLVRFQNMREQLGEQIRRLRGGRDGPGRGDEMDGRVPGLIHRPDVLGNRGPALKR